MAAPLSSPQLPPLPLTVISGYLGSGKTTLLNRLLRAAEGRRIMVLVNDFGAIALDAELIEARDGDTITLANGCVCCSIGSSLFDAFARALDRRPRPDHLVIEASGVAEPRRISAFARAEPELRPDLTVTLADAVNAATQLEDPLIAASLTRQFQAADLLVLNKADLVSDAEQQGLAARLRAINPDAAQVRATRGAVPLDLLLGPGGGPAGEAPVAAEPEPAHEDFYDRWSFSHPDAVAESRLQRLLEQLPPGVLRLKGISHAAGAADLVEFHLAGQHRELRRRPAPPDTRPGLRAVAIGPRSLLPATELDRLFAELHALA